MRKLHGLPVVVWLAASTSLVHANPEMILFWDVRPTAASILTPVSPFTGGQGEEGSPLANDIGPDNSRGGGQILRVCPVTTNSGGTPPGPLHLGASYPNLDNDAN